MNEFIRRLLDRDAFTDPKAKLKLIVAAAIFILAAVIIVYQLGAFSRSSQGPGYVEPPAQPEEGGRKGGGMLAPDS
jgi:hypothetical protein